MDLFSDDDIEEGVQPISHEDYQRLIKYLEENKIEKDNLNVLISVDGGINKNRAIECIESGVDILVIGSALTNNDSKSELLRYVKQQK